jgi:hypothetical protein
MGEHRRLLAEDLLDTRDRLGGSHGLALLVV